MKYGVWSRRVGFCQNIFFHVVTLNDEAIMPFPFAAHLTPSEDDVNAWMDFGQPDPIALFGRYFEGGDMFLLAKVVSQTGIYPTERGFDVALRLISP